MGVGCGQLVVEAVELGVHLGAALFMGGAVAGGGGHVGFGLLELLIAGRADSLAVQALEFSLACRVAGVVAAGELGVVGGVAAPQDAAERCQGEQDGHGLDPNGDGAGLDHWQTPRPQPMVLA